MSFETSSPEVIQLLSCSTHLSSQSSVEFVANTPVICLAVCTTHYFRCSDILHRICNHHYHIVYEMPVFGPVINSKGIVAVRSLVDCICDESRSCSAHFLIRTRPLLLYFPTVSDPITPSHSDTDIEKLKISNEQELMQSEPKSRPQNQRGK